MAFKPHKALCYCHNQERWILNKKGECSETIRQRRRENSIKSGKQNDIGFIEHKVSKNFIPAFKKNKASPPKRKPIQRNRKPSGEGQVFAAIWKEATEAACPEVPRCSICSASLGHEARSYFFSHVLAKSTSPMFRLWKINIWLCCFSCHTTWDQGDRSKPAFAAKRFFAAKLKQFYHQIKDLPEEEQKEEMKIFEYENN